MPDGSEFQTAGAATLKPRDAKVVNAPRHFYQGYRTRLYLL